MKITDCKSETLMLIVSQADGMDPAVGEAAAEIDRRYGEGAMNRYGEWVQRWRSSPSAMLEDVKDNFETVEAVLRGV